MAIKINNTKEIKIDAVKCVVYGGAGVGKTRLCATAPNPIIISAESGLLSLADVECDYIEVKTQKDFDDTFRWAKSSAEAANYDTICLDSLSEICETLLERIVGDYKDVRQAYQALAMSMVPVLRKYRDLPKKHTLFTSKLIIVEDEDSGKVTEELMLPGRVLPNQVPYMVDELFKLKINRKNETVMQTKPDRTSFCKDRSGALANDILKPNMTEIIETIMKKAGQ